MSDSKANRRREQAKLARLEIVSEMYIRQHTVRQIRAIVMSRLNLATYSLSTVHKDIKAVLKELQEVRLDNMEYAVQLELERIDDACRELWEQYNKTKEEGIGDLRFITEIREQLKERRKLLGLYAPEKKELSGEMSFASMLIESGVIGDLDEER
ncbi:MAG: hypothetical protein HUK01_08155 [Bacteroidaceae bacterium]|nr:hypothetical protein [Bacteroidaceae bacterium]